jgi:hypothetical protein
MPVDRVRRDAAADALASFLRRETGRGELADALHLLLSAQNSEEKSKSVHDAYLEEDFIECWLQWERHEPITEQKWLALCRTLASLKTDFEEKPLPRHGGEDGPGQILLARWHTLGLLISLGLSYLISWWVFAAATVLSFLLYQASLYKHDFMADKQREREIKRRMEHYPFEDEAEWLAYKQYLDAFVLPDYDETAFADPTQPRKWPSYLAAPVRVGGYLIIGANVLYMYAFCVVFWPLWLVMMSLCRRELARQKQVNS